MSSRAATITSRANPRVKQLRAAFAGNARLSGGLVAIEGEHLLQEALRSGLPLKTIFVTESLEPPAWLPRSVELMRLPSDVFSSAVDTQHPQGIAALLVPPVWSTQLWGRESAEPAGAPLFLLAARLQDPGNLGTLIRSAEAFGASAVLTTQGTVSEWNQKALRASAGSVFRVPLVAVSTEQLVDHKNKGLRLFAAVAPDSKPGHGTIPVGDADLTQPCVLMIGNEGAGLPEELLAIADVRIAIPMLGRIESLNAGVAGSLLLYEASRQRALTHR